jgi:ribosome biogenesis GTPase
VSQTEGIVIRATSGIYTVQSNGHVVQCTLRGNLKKDLQYNTSASVARRVTRAKRPYTRDALVVGDRVRYSETHNAAGIIEEILPRTSRFSRSGFRGKEHTLVSNLDLLCVVFASAEPRLDPWKLDRFLVAAESEDIPPLIVANKKDLVDDRDYHAAFDPFAALGYRVFPTSAKKNEGIDDLRAALNDKVTAFVGPSGAGKSSLLNAIQPGLNLVTADIGNVTFKGRHTTTSAQLIPLRSGGWVADTPGLRNFDILDLDSDDVKYCFPEFKDLLGQCRFDDCRHHSEPGCAIKQAVDSGAVQSRRYESFLILAKELSGK